jgi:hypothetical protein
MYYILLAIYPHHSLWTGHSEISLPSPCTSYTLDPFPHYPIHASHFLHCAFLLHRTCHFAVPAFLSLSLAIPTLTLYTFPFLQSTPFTAIQKNCIPFTSPFLQPNSLILTFLLNIYDIAFPSLYFLVFYHPSLHFLDHDLSTLYFFDLPFLHSTSLNMTSYSPLPWPWPSYTLLPRSWHSNTQLPLPFFIFIIQHPLFFTFIIQTLLLSPNYAHLPPPELSSYSCTFHFISEYFLLVFLVASHGFWRSGEACPVALQMMEQLVITDEKEWEIRFTLAGGGRVRGEGRGCTSLRGENSEQRWCNSPTTLDSQLTLQTWTLPGVLSPVRRVIHEGGFSSVLLLRL